MITKLDYELLVLYRDPRPWPEDAEDEKRFRGLLARKLVEPVGYKPEDGGLTATHYQASPAGEDALLSFEQAQKAAKQARARFWIGTAIAAAGAAAAIAKMVLG